MMSRMIDIALAVLARSGVEHYEVYAVEEARLNVEARKGEVEAFERSLTSGFSIRVLAEERLGFSYCTEASQEAVSQCVSRAVEGARGSAPDPLYSLTPPSASPLPRMSIHDPRMGEVDEAEKIKRALALERAAREFDPRIVQTHRAGYMEVEVHTRLINSLGLDVEAVATRASCQIMAMAAQDREQEMRWEFDSSHTYAGLDVEQVGREAARKAVEMLGARRIASARCPVVFEPGAAADMVEFVGASFLAENVLKHKSMLAGKLDRVAFSPMISMMDDGIRDGGFASFPFDAEGSPSQATRVVEKGRICRFLCDRYYARRMGISSTGNSQRQGIFVPPGTGVTNFYIVNGESDPTGLIRGIHNGLMVRELLGMHTANPVTGDFSLGAAGFWIQDGELAHPVKGIALAGNIMELLAKVDAVGNDLRFFANIGSPSIRVEMLDVSGQ